MLRSLVGSEMCIRDSINAEYGGCESIHMPLLYGVNGFGFAPVSRALLTITAAGSLIVPTLFPNTAMDLTLRVLLRGHVWRVASSQLLFSTPAELLFGSMLLYYTRLLERLMGSAQFAGFVLVTVALCVLLQIAILVVVPSSWHVWFGSGPYGLIFACIVVMHYRVPRLRSFTVLGQLVSDKLFLYLIAAQLLLNNMHGSLAAGLVGIAAGMAHRHGFVRLQKLAAPLWLRRKLGPPMGWSENAKVVAYNETVFQQALNRHQQAGEQMAAADQLVPNPFGQLEPELPAGMAPGGEPPAELVQELAALTGANAAAIRQALQQTGNNPDAATNMLLDQMS
eukprot:TRINITY_DN21508_c0_g1_i1.p1 TRINITY_DN21508_c0_g1~~TRINITY_DN21508_c0_g1_i1.p1  ORF type:complete len:349 (-),score=90.71 TRINITY_DN21508_c0_g1_i1:297-1310(-)